jgi:hypothetical protein
MPCYTYTGGPRQNEKPGQIDSLVQYFLVLSSDKQAVERMCWTVYGLPSKSQISRVFTQLQCDIYGVEVTVCMNNKIIDIY